MIFNIKKLRRIFCFKININIGTKTKQIILAKKYIEVT
jgi:hypothetical protein